MYSFAAHRQLTGSSLWHSVPSAGIMGRDDRTQRSGKLCRNCQHVLTQLCSGDAQEESCPRRLKRGGGAGRATGFAN